MSDLIITVPVAGWAAPLDEVPDPVFAERMMGDGVAIHPTGSTVHAPCDGVIASLHAARHAVTVRSDAGAEILIHVGLDTVGLGGKGFRALVAEGAKVSQGDALIEFDMDAVGVAATSLVVPVIVANSDAFRIDRRVTAQIVGVGEALMTLSPITGEAPGSTEGGVLTRTISVGLVHGIHARPAARIGECARGFEAEVEVVCGGRRANVRSPVALMALGLNCDEEIMIEARGREARQALAAVGDLIASGMGEVSEAPAPKAAVEAPMGALAGICASPGLAIGTAAWLDAEEVAIEPDATDSEAETAALDAALGKVHARIAGAAEQGGEAQRGIFEAHLAFLGDEDLIAAARAQIAAGRSAGFGWREAIGAQIASLRGAGGVRFVERVSDLEDLDRQVQLALAGREPEGQSFEPGTVLLAHDLLPSQLIGLDRANVSGVALKGGGPTSHVAILAASMGLPMLVAVPVEGIEPGTALVLDADSGLLYVDPTEDTLDGHREAHSRMQERRAAALEAAHEPSRTADGKRIEVFANLGSLDDATLAVARGAEGSGLLRTEFLFMGRASAPDEEEQLAAYQAIADAMAGRPLIVRLLDIGGDKPAPYVRIGAEKNPMLGQRGVRVSLANPELLDAQVRAILRVRPAGQCRIMVPMITGLPELRAVRAAVDRAAAELGVSGTQLGVMIETPAAAATADLIAAEADFLSIGTNDLTQYTLAMDRENAAVAAGVDALHPAVLRLIAHTGESGARHGRTVGVCGGLASDPLGIPLLIGLGVTELSATPAFVPEAKALVRRFDTEACRALAAQALELGSATEIRALARAFVKELN